MFPSSSALQTIHKNVHCMESTTQLTLTFEICEEKAAKVIRWLSESEDIARTQFAVARLFETGVLQDNTKGFVHLLLEEKYPGDRIKLELLPEEMQRLLTDAFTQTYLYLLTPQSFISEFLSFDKDFVRTDHAMLARLSYFVDYPYFPDMLDEWFAINLHSGQPEIRKSDLQKLLRDIDRSIMKYSSVDEIVKYHAPLYEYFGSDEIDRDTLDVLLTDKNLTVAADNDRAQFPRSDLAFTIKEAYMASELVTPVVDELPPIQEYDTFLKELREVGVVLPPPHHIAKTVTEEAKQLPPIQLFIHSKLRKRCIAEVFHSNVNEYERALVMLNAIKDYSHAELNLSSTLHIHKIEPDSKVAIRLHEALRLRFAGTLPK